MVNRNVNAMQNWKYWQMSGHCQRLQRRLWSWEKELRTNKNGLASCATLAIYRIKEMMAAHGC